MKKGKMLTKTLTMLLAVLMLAGVCASCSKQEVVSQKTAISISDWPSTEGSRLNMLEKNKKDFEVENNNIEIIPDNWVFDLQSFYPKAEAGMLPNIFTAPFTEISKMVDGEYVMDMTEVLKNNNFYDNMNEKIRDLVSYDGKVYALPYEAYSVGVAYNTEMFEVAGLVEADGTPKQPKDWYEWAEFAVKIKEATGKPGIVFMTTDNCGGWMFTNIAWSFGTKFMQQEADGSWKSTFDTPETVQALQFIKDLRWKYDVLPENVLINMGEMQRVFATGGAGMTMSTPLWAPAFASFEMKPEQFGMLAIPAGPAKHVSLVGGAVRLLSNRTDDAQADTALKWIDFIGEGWRLDDVVKENIENSIKTNLEEGIPVGAKSLSIWKDDSEKVAYQNELIDKNTNMKPNSAKFYNEALNSPDIELQPEEPVCAQDLYALLDTCIQQVINNQDADCAAIIKKANQDFQTNFLNNVEY